MEVQGIIDEVFEPRKGTTNGSEWEMQEFVVCYGYASDLKHIVLTVNLKSDKIKWNPVKGMKGKFLFSINARRDMDRNRWFNSIRCYDYEPFKQQSQVSEGPAVSGDGVPY